MSNTANKLYQTCSLFRCWVYQSLRYNRDMRISRDWFWVIIGMIIFSAAMMMVNKLPETDAETASSPQKSKINPDYISLAEQFIIEFDLESAEEALTTVLISNQNNPHANILLGLIFSITEPDRASGYLSKAADLNPNYYPDSQKMIATIQRSDFAEDQAYRLIQIGQSLSGIGQWHLAKEAFSLATLENPQYSEAWAYLGMSKMQLGLEPLIDLEKALALNPYSVSANIFYAKYFSSIGEPELGLVYLHTILEIDPQNPFLITEAGNYLAEMGNPIGAYSYFETMVLKSPTEFDPWFQLANFSINYEYQISQIGLPAIRKALIISPKDPSAIILLGRAYSMLGNPNMGIKLINDGLLLSPKDINGLYHLGIINISLGNLTEAEALLIQALSLSSDPDQKNQIQNILDIFID